MPFYSMPPGGKESKLCHAFVPVDDHTTARWSFSCYLNRPYTAAEKAALTTKLGIQEGDLILFAADQWLNESVECLASHPPPDKVSQAFIGELSSRNEAFHQHANFAPWR